MTRPKNKTLLALLFAFKDLETPLSKDEQLAFTEIAEQLAANPDAWDVLIEPRLLEVVQANSKLRQLFDKNKSQLDNLKDNLLPDQLPSQEILDKVVPIPRNQIEVRVIPIFNPDDFKSDEIVNMVIRVMETPNPLETSKKLFSNKQSRQ